MAPSERPKAAKCGFQLEWLFLYQSRLQKPSRGLRGKGSAAVQKTQETKVRSLGQEDTLEEGMATHSGILAWRIPWTEKPCGLQFMGLQIRTQLND